ncbi:MAG: bifunctional nuclease family protein [Candidatus Eiseniibacteriota bacterium]|nr:MAG: bifunctional nuclease family protein [Candidatus Eisenbacteria bacterium]
MIEVKVGGLTYDDNAKSPVVFLKERDGTRVLPIWIGPAEANAIALEMVGKKFQRPLTHDLMATIVRGLKAKVSRVVISDLRDNTFYASVVLEREKEKEMLNVDARPSDGIALALRTRSPIFLADKLLEGARDLSSLKEEEKEQPAEEGKTKEKEKEKEKTEEERAEELRKFLEDLNPEDFGKLTP